MTRTSGKGAGPPCADPIWIFYKRDYGLPDSERQGAAAQRKAGGSAHKDPRNDEHHRQHQRVQDKCDSGETP